MARQRVFGINVNTRSAVVGMGTALWLAVGTALPAAAVKPVLRVGVVDGAPPLQLQGCRCLAGSGR